MPAIRYFSGLEQWFCIPQFLKPFRNVKNIKDCLDREEVERILAAAAETGERDYLIIRTM